MKIVFAMRLVTYLLMLSLFLFVNMGEQAGFEPPVPEWKVVLSQDPNIKVNVRGINKVGDRLPSTYACDGESRIPTIRWNAVSGAKSYLVVVYDPDAPVGTFYHLVGVVDAPVTMISDKTEWKILGHNSGGKEGWFPVCPPPMDKPHRYYFLVVALNYVPVQLPAYDALPKMLKDRVIGWGWTMGTYSRN